MSDPTIKEPTSPGAAAALSVGRNALIILAGVSTVWTCFNQGGLKAVYDWLNSIAGAPFLALASLGAVVGWNALKNWRDKKAQKSTHTALHLLTGATTNAELNSAVKAINDANPEGEKT